MRKVATIVVVGTMALAALAACSSGGGGGPALSDGGGVGGSALGGGTGGGGTGGSGTGGSSTGGVGPGPNRTIEEYCQLDADLAKAWCDYADQCCSQADKDDLHFNFIPLCSFGPTDPAECVTFVNDHIADGTLAFDGTWADACIGKRAAGIPAPPASCSGLPGSAEVLNGHGTPSQWQIPECRKVWVGLVQVGGACEYESQCAEGLKCDDDGSGSYVCQPVGVLGSPCVLHGDCDDNLVCNSKSNQCATLSSTGGSCLFADECENGLICSSDTCATPVNLGGSCAGSSDSCAPGTGCSLSTSTCIALGQDGQGCSVSLECLGRCDSISSQCTTICGGHAY